jgi:hypothetical protein
LQGEPEELQFKVFSAPVQFEWKDLDHDGTPEFIFASGNEVCAFSADKNQEWQYTFNKPVTGRLVFFTAASGMIHTGISCGQSSEVWLLDEHGKPLNGSPFTGAFGPAVGDLNHDGSLNVITISGKLVSVFGME